MQENITSILSSVLLQVYSMSNNANGNKWVMFFSGTAWYYDNDFIFDLQMQGFPIDSHTIYSLELDVW